MFGHYENKRQREEICANCGQPKHSADETGCKRPAKCINCKEDHPANSRQCQTEIYQEHILPESYTAPPGKSYANIKKTACVTVSCVDAATQTTPVLITGAPQSSTYNAASTEASADSVGTTSETLSRKEKRKAEKTDRKLEQNIRGLLAKRKMNNSARPPDHKKRGKEKFLLQIGSGKDMRIRLSNTIGFLHWMT